MSSVKKSPNYLSIIKNKYIPEIPEKKNLLYLLCYIIVKRKDLRNYETALAKSILFELVNNDNRFLIEETNPLYNEFNINVLCYLIDYANWADYTLKETKTSEGILLTIKRKGKFLGLKF